MSLFDLDFRIKKLFPVLRVTSHLPAVGIRKWEGYALIHLLLVLVTLALLKITTAHELSDRYNTNSRESSREV